MAFVFIDNEFYKITLEFTRDFIDNNYDEWIENNEKEEIKISRWEMMIYFKKLNNVSKDTIDYFLIDAESRLTFMGSRSIHVNNNNTIKQKIEICKNPVFIKLVLLSKDEKYKDSHYNVVNDLKNVLSNVISQLDGNEYTKYYDKERKLQTFKSNIFKSFNCNETRQTFFRTQNTDNVTNQYSCEIECILVSIVKKHYREIIDNIEGYILYCKTEKIKIDFNKIGKFINFIKEYVKSIYGFDLI